MDGGLRRIALGPRGALSDTLGANATAVFPSRRFISIVKESGLLWLALRGRYTGGWLRLVCDLVDDRP